jgi:hypothetical protein
MLAKIFDPRGWMSATNEVDEALQRMAEGPRLADLWNVERQFAEVFTAWVRMRQRSLEHNKVIQRDGPSQTERYRSRRAGLRPRADTHAARPDRGRGGVPDAGAGRPGIRFHT